MSSIRGWIKGNPADIRDIVVGGGHIDLAELDSRLEGQAVIPTYRTGTDRFDLLGNGPVKVEGSELSVGERVRIATGEEILWGR